MLSLRHRDTDLTGRMIFRIIVLIILIAGVSSSAIAGTPTPFKIKAGVLPDRVAPGRQFVINVLFTIEHGYQLYADNTKLTATPVPGLIFDKVKADPPTQKRDPDGTTVRIYEKHVTFELPVSVDKSVKPGEKTIPLTMTYTGCTKTSCFLPEKKQLDVTVTITTETDAKTENARPADFDPSPDDKPKEKQNPFQNAAARFGILGVMAAAFIWGIFASLTPCVYPMIPVTVSVIGASGSKSISRSFFLSAVYVLGMSLVYAGFGVAAAWSGSLFGAYSDHMAVRMVVAAVFILMGLSMFDLFYIQMPSTISSRLGGKTGAGALGVFLAGGAAGAAVGPCVGPMLVGLLIYIAALGNKVYGFLIMWSFSLGLGILFMLIGTFSGAAAALPKSGIWMERLKYTFGILMFAIALFYIKPLLPLRIFLLLLDAFLVGIGIFIGAVWIAKTKQTGKGKLATAMAIVGIALCISIVSQFINKDTAQESYDTKEKSGIVWLKDEKTALDRALKNGQPIMIDFSASWCKACTDLKNKTFSNPDVIAETNNFVCLWVDCTAPKEPEPERLLKKYQVVGLPTILFLTAEGTVIPDKTITQFIKHDKFLPHLRQIE